MATSETGGDRQSCMYAFIVWHISRVSTLENITKRDLKDLDDIHNSSNKYVNFGNADSLLSASFISKKKQCFPRAKTPDS